MTQYTSNIVSIVLGRRITLLWPSLKLNKYLLESSEISETIKLFRRTSLKGKVELKLIQVIYYLGE